MKLYVGNTDRDWFRFLRAKHAVEMNFWRPRSTRDFSAISTGELFLFKLRYPENRIVGGAFLVRHEVYPLDLAWDIFGEANGCSSREELRRMISSIRGDNERNPMIGCTVLTDPFYLEDSNSLAPPNDWAPNIVMGKSYDALHGEGARLFEAARIAQQLKGTRVPNVIREDTGNRYGTEILVRPRLGQGGFRVVVMEGYSRRCAITGEKTLPVLEAAHIKPYAEQGPHELSNGLLLRSDFHTLFDKGYITVTTDHRIEVSKRIREEFSNGHEYYAHHGRTLQTLPTAADERPAKEFLEWHQSNRFLGN